jgi:hypothetical protein
MAETHFRDDHTPICRRPFGPPARWLTLLSVLVSVAGVPAAHGQNLTASSTAPFVAFDVTTAAGVEWFIGADQVSLFVELGGGGTVPIEARSSGDVYLADRNINVQRFPVRLGIRTLDPQGDLHISGDTDQDIFSGIGADLVTGPAFNFGYAGSSFGRSSGFFNVRPDALASAPNPSLRFATANVVRMIIDNQGFVGLGAVANPIHPLQLQSGAHVTAGGVWTDASSREYKQDIAPLAADAALAALGQLTPVTFAYRADPAEHHVGFVAEDVPALVATADRKGLSPMDIVAVLTRVVQEQQQAMEDQRRATQAALAELRAEMAALRHAAGR